jgi:hypothetical protein
LAGRMRAVGCRLPVMSKICDTKLLEARMISSFKYSIEKEMENRPTHTRFEFTIPVSNWPKIIRTLHCATAIMKSSVWAARPTQTLHSRQTGKRTTDTGSCCSPLARQTMKLMEVCYTNTTCFPDCRVSTFSVFLKHCIHYNQICFYLNA